MLGTVTLSAQDKVLLKTGDELEVQLLEVTATEIAYWKTGQPEGPIFRLGKDQILLLTFANGDKEVMQATPVPTATPAPPTPAEVQAKQKSLRQKGKKDASMHYKGKNSGAGWTAATVLVFSPLFGLIPAAAFSVNEPSDSNLNYPDETLMEEYAYQKAYIEEAHRKKKSKVWTSYGMSSAIWLLLILLL